MKKMRIISMIIIEFALLLFHCTDATTYMVGDALNWVDPPTPTTYSIWASSNVFVKDDVLVFNFNNGSHNVAEVTKKAYNKCNTRSLISLHHQSPVSIPLNKEGIRYFISTLNNDCLNGKKLAINVLQHLPPPPPATPPPEIAPGSNSPTLPPAVPTIDVVITPPSPSTNSAPSYFGPNVTFLSVMVTLICGVLCQIVIV
ncbi:cucumber peeling cupredoxin-like [Chenopodium quinoa]|uniref:cucumber peeling cupredoxin-like n=1 Tax=Chenopodium quinoa TaxID=63459 RepID=UPI000B77568B|nr:cucumber peeling cupredoxin-like [Chenopodium quinoa]